MQAAVDVEVGGVAFHRTAEGEDDFADAALTHAPDEAFDFEVGGCDAVHRRNDTTQHMVEAMILGGGFDGHDVLIVLNHTDLRRIAQRIGTDGAYGLIADVVTNLAIVDVMAQGGQTLRKVVHCLGVEFQQMKHQTQSGLASDAWKFCKFIDCPLEQGRGKCVVGCGHLFHKNFFTSADVDAGGKE